MTGSEPQRASCLRKRFLEIAPADRDKQQAFSIRVWRALSWLDHAEQVLDCDRDGRFISLWIAFNAIYGRSTDGGLETGDRASWQSFLAVLFGRDADDLLGEIVRGNRELICELVECRYLYRPFWLNRDTWQDTLRRASEKTQDDFDDGHVLPILQELFERLYVLRTQVFHGAATSGSKLNRETLQGGTHLLSLIVPAMIEIVIAAGPETVWGDVCFPPLD